MNVGALEVVMAVRIRLMKAVFFFREESRVGLMAKMPIFVSVYC